VTGERNFGVRQGSGRMYVFGRLGLSLSYIFQIFLCIQRLLEKDMCVHSLNLVAKLCLAGRNEFCSPAAGAIFAVSLLAVKRKARSNTTDTYGEMLSAAVLVNINAKR